MRLSHVGHNHLSFKRPWRRVSFLRAETEPKPTIRLPQDAAFMTSEIKTLSFKDSSWLAWRQNKTQSLLHHTRLSKLLVCPALWTRAALAFRSGSKPAIEVRVRARENESESTSGLGAFCLEPRHFIRANGKRKKNWNAGNKMMKT